jgi:preprotein translocase subunit SecG
MLHTILITIHLLVATVIVGLVLIQRGKGADAGAGFGAGASGTVFGARGTHTVFSRATAVLAYIGAPKEVATSALEQQIEQSRTAPPAPAVAPAAQPAPSTGPAPAPGAPATSTTSPAKP